MDNYFREWREYAQMSQVELAKIMKVTPTTVSRIEQGHRDFNGKYLEAFAKAIGCRHCYDPISRPPDMFALGTSFSTPELLKEIVAIYARLNRKDSNAKRGTGN